MKFHRLQLKNLNSLYGRHTIDFDEALGKPPLFLIRGPTGSGKTTILDAICLALFGTTPRLMDIGSAADRCAKILSDGEGRAHVELDFSLRDKGVRRYFRARWEFWRSHDRPRGAPQNPRRSLSEIDARGEEKEKLVNSRTQTKYEEVFDDVLRGLSVDDFFRSVMLAQNQFAAFLKAGQEEKASILESLTRTDRYQQIGKVAAGKWFEKRDAIDDQKTRIQTLKDQIPESEDLEGLEDKLKELNEKKKALQNKLKTKQEHLEWLNEEERLKGDKKKASDEQENAEKERKEKSAKFKALKAAQSVEPGREPLRSLENHEEELKGLRDKVDELRERRDKLAEVVEELEGEKKKLEDDKRDARKAVDEARPEIKKGRELSTTLKSLQKSLDDGEKKLEQRRKTLKKYESDREKAKKQLDDLKSGLQKAGEELDSKKHLESLPREFAGLKQQVASVNDEVSRVEGAVEALEELAEELQGIEEEIETLKGQLKEEEKALEPLEEELNVAEKKKQSLQGESESLRERRKELRERRDALNQELQLLEKGAELLDKIENRRKALGERETSIENMEKEQRTLVDKIEEAEKDLKEVNEKLKGVEEEVGELEVAREVHKYRLHLESEDGASCPVCGSEEHPLLQEQSADELHAKEASKLEELSERRGKLKENAEELNEAVSKDKEAKIKLASDLENTEENATKDREIIVELEDNLSTTLGEVDESLSESVGEKLEDEVGPLTLIEAAKKERAEEVESVDETIDEIDNAEEAFEKSQKELSEAKETVGKLEKQVGTLETKLEEKEKDQTRRSEKLEKKRADLVGNFENLVDRFDAFDIKLKTPQGLEDDSGIGCEGVGNSLDEALKEAEKKKENYEELKSKGDELKEKKGDLENKLKNLGERIEGAEKEVKDAGEQVEKEKKEVESTRGELEELLQGRDLDEWEKGLEKTLKKATKAVDDIREKLEDENKKYAAAKQAFDGNQENIESRKKKVDQAKRALEETLEKLDVDGREALEDALMNAEELEELRKTCQAIENKVESARKLFEKVKKELETHVENRPDALDEEMAQEAVQKEVEGLTKEVNQLAEEIGKKGATLEEGKNRLKNLAEAQEELDRLNAEAKPWRKLHNLIGKGGGKHFKLFAQSLNLGEIIRRANEHLSRLEDRYKLAIKPDENGFPTLEFEVVDRYLANQRRSLETLSGGETFLISLALSLALADNKRLDLPIETIFLDEGFGTLDQEALQTAMNCLNQLHYRGGRTVGVISHVEALHRDGGISHQIVLETVGEGVSKIRIERP